MGRLGDQPEGGWRIPKNLPRAARWERAALHCNKKWAGGQGVEKGGYRHPEQGAWATGSRQQMHESGCGGKAAAADTGSKAGRSGVSAEAEAHGT